MDNSLLALPEKLSPSRIKDYMQCPKLFYYKSILKLPTKGTIHTLRGEVVHLVLEQIFTHPTEERGVDQAVLYAKGALNLTVNPVVAREEVLDPYETKLRDALDLWDLSEKEVERALKKSYDSLEILELNGGAEQLLLEVIELINSYYKMENPLKFDPKDRELHVEAEIKGYKIQGYIDRLDVFEKKGVEEVYISDYKTGSVPGERYLEEAFFAMKIYALLLKLSKGVSTKALRLLYVKTGERSGIKSFEVDEKTLEATQKQVGSVISNIKKDFKTESWSTKKGPLCNWCSFKDICPEFNSEMSDLSISPL
jgi:putative RecB family exonuclease